MPGMSFRGDPPSLSPAEVSVRDELAADVQKLAGEIGERNVGHYQELAATVEFIAQSFIKAGFTPRREGYDVAGKFCENIEVEIGGSSPEIVVVGAHYDSVSGSPGANDNGSGVAALLALARRFGTQPNVRTLRFVAFANEEPGFFQSEQMGSWVYANRCQMRGDRVVAMVVSKRLVIFRVPPDRRRFPFRGWERFIRQRGTSLPLSVIFLHARSSGRPSEHFASTRRCPRRERRCLRMCRASVGRITGPSGSMAILG